jgi:hypothetical protein
LQVLSPVRIQLDVIVMHLIEVNDLPVSGERRSVRSI